MGAYIFLNYEFSPGICPGAGLQDYMATLFLVLRNLLMFSIVVVPVNIPSHKEGPILNLRLK